ncbi:DNA-binding domain-containing protein [Vibrio profundum]|uniref:HvfC/BufC N-terminal domain-containing protein n=1 Tax=Vibrio profundum TaxID=2910247 RepID=UPI003D0A33A7
MSISLSQLQDQFALALQYQATAEECGIVIDHFDAEARIQIYRNNFIISLTDVLTASYPMVQALVGKECFTQLARHHVLSKPLLNGNVITYGEGFDISIACFPAVLGSAPYLPEVARYEWMLDISQQQASVTSTPPQLRPIQQLTDLDESEHNKLVFHCQPGLQIFESTIAVFSLQHAIQHHQFEDLTLDQAESGALVTFPNGDTYSCPLESNCIHLIAQLQSNQPLATINPDLLGSLNTLIENNLVAGFTLSQ